VSDLLPLTGFNQFQSDFGLGFDKTSQQLAFNHQTLIIDNKILRITIRVELVQCTCILTLRAPDPPVS
jgi:hypothetical protein